LLEPVRQYAAEQLAADPSEAAAARDGHCRYYAQWVHARGATLKGPQQLVAIAEITTEIDNIRAAWQHAVDHRQTEPLWLMSEEGTYVWFLELRSWYQEGETMCQRATDALRTTRPATAEETALLGTVLGVLGWFTFRRGRTAEGTALLAEGMAVLRTVDYPLLLLFTLCQSAYIAAINGDIAQAIVWQDELMVVADRVGSPWAREQAYFQRAVVYAEHAPEIAYERFQEGLPSIRAGGDRYVLGLSLFFLGQVALALGNVREAETHFSEALQHSLAIRNGVGEVTALHGLAMVACARGAWEDAITYSVEAVTRSRDVGDQWSRAKALATLGQAEAGSGDYVAARSHFAKAISVSLAARVLPTAIDAWLGQAALDIEADELNSSLLTILACVRNHPATSRHAAATAATLWTALEDQVESHALANAEDTARRVVPDQLGSLLGAYADGSAAAMLDSLPVSPADG
jgi:tetratricopeptide (TPR) repeat protein